MTGNQKTQQNKQVQKQNRVQKPKENVKHQFNSEQMRTAPETMRKDEVLVAQKQLGNQTVQRSFDHSSRSAQMTDEKGYLNKSISDTIQQKRGVGGALPITMQKEGEQNLGQNFSDVRIHTDASADNLSKQINAKAFTIGKDIFFRQGEYSPNTSKGRETLLHEMTHVVQQSGTPTAGGRLKLGAPNTSMEHEAEHVGKKAVQNSNAKTTVKSGKSAAAVQRSILDWFKKKDKGKEATKHRLDVMKKGKLDFAKMSMGDEDTKKAEKGEKVKTYAGDMMNTMKKKEGITPDALQAQIKKMGVGSDESLKKMDQFNEKDSRMMQAGYMVGERNLSKTQLDAMKGSPNIEKEQTKNKLMAIIQNPDSKEEDVKKAKDQLNELFGGKFTDIQKIFHTDMGSDAITHRRQALKARAQRGEEGALEKYQNFKKENPTLLGKIGGFVKKHATLDNAKTGFGYLKSAFTSSGNKEETPQAMPQMGMGMMGMGMMGGGGMGQIMQEYARVMQENKELKAKLEEKGQ